MYELRVNGKIYKIVFRYKVLVQSNLIDDLMNAQSGNAEKPSEALKNLIGLTAELLLAGLQRHHSDEFGYDFESKTEHDEMLWKVCDLIDDYEDENDGEKGGFTLYNDLNAELEKSNFLSQIMRAAAQTAAEQDAAILPTDHLAKKRAKKVGEKS